MLQRSLSNTEDECSHLQKQCEASQKELEDLAEKHREAVVQVHGLEEKLQVMMVCVGCQLKRNLHETVYRQMQTN